MAVVITIATVDKTAAVRRESLRIDKDDAVETASFTTWSRDLTSGAYRPALGAAVRVTQDSALLFGGLIDEVRDRATDSLNHGATEVECRAVGYHTLPQRVLVTANYAAGEGAYKVYADLCAILTTYYSVTNIGTTTGGAVLPAIAWDHVTVAEALNQINTITAGLGTPYYWRINGDKQFVAGPLGSDTGASFTAANATVIRAFAWESSRATTLTRAWAKVGESGAGVWNRSQSWTGNGSRVNFYLDCAPGIAPTEVTENGSTVAVPSATWTYESTRMRLVRASALGNGVVLNCIYPVYYPAYCRAETEAQIDAGNLYEAVYAYPDVLDLDQGVALAAGHLAQQVTSPKRVRLQTRSLNIYPLQTCTLTFADRVISGDYLSRRVSISDLGKKGDGLLGLLYDVELWETAGLGGSWLDWWRSRSVSGGAAVVTTGSGGGPLQTTIVQGVGRCYLGGSRTVAVQTGAGTYVAHPEYVDVILDSTKVPATLTVSVECRTTSGAVSVTPRIVSGSGDWSNETTVGTGVATTSTSWAWQSITVTTRAGSYAYRLKLAASAANTDVLVAGAMLEW